MKKLKLFKYKFVRVLAIIIASILLLAVGFNYFVKIDEPEVADRSALELKRITIGKDYYVVDDSWLKKNEYGLWEMYVSGSDFELGVKNGMLAQELIHYQEEVFVESISELIPSKSYLNFLKHFIALFNRNIDEYIPLEYQREVYGISLFASDDFNAIGPNYHRILNYHGAHDIGHTLQNMNLVGCTAFGVKNARTADSSLLIGRNMDFYSGDKFAENKIIAFCNPDKGHSFAYVTWGGLIGVISGMNDQGLTISLNAAKSPIPSSAKMPVSILARTILQYASTIDEAYAIAKKYDTFVAETFLIGSAKDNDMAVIEKTPEDIDLYRTGADQLIVSNHYQGNKFKNSELNSEGIQETSTIARWNRAEELLAQQSTHYPTSFASILRNTKGAKGAEIGLGNEDAINQLIAHHSVIFQPKQLIMYVSTSPYQLGAYLAYDLKKIFNDSLPNTQKGFEPALTIAADPFVNTQAYRNYEAFRKESKRIKQLISAEQSINGQVLKDFLALNPNYYYGYKLLGDYFAMQQNNEKAIAFYTAALRRDIPLKADKDHIHELIAELSGK